MSSSNCCFLTCIQVSHEAVQVVLYSHLFQNFPQFIVIQSCPILSDPIDCSPSGFSVYGILQASILAAGCHFLLQQIFPTQGLNPGPLHFRQILYHLSHQGNPLKIWPNIIHSPGADHSVLNFQIYIMKTDMDHLSKMQYNSHKISYRNRELIKVLRKFKLNMNWNSWKVEY